MPMACVSSQVRDRSHDTAVTGWVFFFFLGPEAHGGFKSELGIKSELQLLAYTTAMVSEPHLRSMPQLAVMQDP